MWEVAPQLEMVRPLDTVVLPSMVAGAVTKDWGAVLMSG